MSEETCSNCKYFVDLNVIGQCRRFPKFENKRGDDPKCGEFFDLAFVLEDELYSEKEFYTDLIKLPPQIDCFTINDTKVIPKKKGRPKGSKNVDKEIKVQVIDRKKRGRPPKNAQTIT